MTNPFPSKVVQVESMKCKCCGKTVKFVVEVVIETGARIPMRKHRIMRVNIIFYPVPFSTSIMMMVTQCSCNLNTI